MDQVTQAEVYAERVENEQSMDAEEVEEQDGKAQGTGEEG